MSLFLNHFEVLIPSSHAQWEIYHDIAKEEIFSHIADITYDKNHYCFTSKNHHHFIAKLQNEYVAMLQLENLASNELALRIIAVKKAFQKNNIGRNLLLFVNKFCLMHGFKAIRTHANLRATEFYKANGFIEDPWADCSINKDTKDMIYLI